MKKIVILFLSACLLMAMTGCAKSGAPTAEGVAEKYKNIPNREDTKIIIDTDLTF